jgi:hypothetical protein
MDVKFNVKYKFKVNGKEYGSLEEMPASVREAYERAVDNTNGIELGNIPSMSSGKIVFNGQEYESIDSMPADTRRMYETIMKSVQEGGFSATGKAGFKIGEATAGFRNEGLASYNNSKPIVPKSSSSRIFIIVVIIALLAGIYFLLSISGSR